MVDWHMKEKDLASIICYQTMKSSQNRHTYKRKCVYCSQLSLVPQQPKARINQNEMQNTTNAHKAKH